MYLLRQSKYWLLLSCLGVALSLGLIGCGGGSNIRIGEEGVETTLEVEFYRNGCLGEGSFLCLLTRSNSTDFEFFYDSISGFSFQWGYRYTLRVLETAVDDPPADGSSVNYSLLEVVDMQAATDVGEFTVNVLSVDLHIVKQAHALYAFSDGKTFTCSAADCATIDSLIAQKFSASIAFELAPDLDRPLILKRIDCSDSPDSFFLNCG